MLRPSAGVAYIGGVEVWRDPLRAKALMGVLPEQLNLYERLTGRELIEFAGRLYRPSARRGPAAAPTRCSRADARPSDADKLVVDYSVGMRKKVALAAALIHRPQVLFLDEPFEGIDPVSSRVIRDILRDLTRTGTTIFFSSHIMEVVERLCTRVGIITQGTLIAEGTLAELRARAGEANSHPGGCLPRSRRRGQARGGARVARIASAASAPKRRDLPCRAAESLADPPGARAHAASGSARSCGCAATHATGSRRLASSCCS